jgi:hypothetical protein
MKHWLKLNIPGGKGQLQPHHKKLFRELPENSQDEAAGIGLLSYLAEYPEPQPVPAVLRNRNIEC